VEVREVYMDMCKVGIGCVKGDVGLAYSRSYLRAFEVVFRDGWSFGRGCWGLWVVVHLRGGGGGGARGRGGWRWVVLGEKGLGYGDLRGKRGDFDERRCLNVVELKNGDERRSRRHVHGSHGQKWREVLRKMRKKVKE